MKRIVGHLMSILGFILLSNTMASAQTGDLMVRVKNNSAYPIPKSLLKVVSVNINNKTMAEALELIAELGGVQFNYNQNRIPVSQKVSLNMDNVSAVEALINILEQTQTELLITEQGQLAIVPNADSQMKATVTGRVLDKETGMALVGTNIVLMGTYSGAATDNDGYFKIMNLSRGKHTLRFSYIGYKTIELEVDIGGNNSTIDLNVELLPEPIKLSEIIVTPGQFAIMNVSPTIPQNFTRQEIEAVPQIGEDIYRAIQRLPGLGSNDFSAKFTVRGGEHDQVLVLLDGLELYEPFHLKEFGGGALSIVDADATEGINLMTGGFPAQFGNRISAVFEIKSRNTPAGKKRYSLGISFMNMRAMTEGTFAGDKGSWFISARRGYLDFVFKFIENDLPMLPTYYDVLSKIKYKLSDSHTIMVNLLHANDKFEGHEFDDIENEKLNNSYGSTYAWTTLNSFITPKLFVRSIASLSRIVYKRNFEYERIADYIYPGEVEYTYFDLLDDREFMLYGFKQDWDLELDDNWYLTAGLDLTGMTGNYDYRKANRVDYYSSDQESFQQSDSAQTRIDLSGSRVGGYISNRFKILNPVTAELGARYDRTSYSGDETWSPRVNFAWAITPHTSIRYGWGYFYQSEMAHEIRIQDGEDDFHRAQLSKQNVIGLEYHAPKGVHIRVEGYIKKLSRLRPEYRNLNYPMSFFPELYSERYQLNLNGSEAKGIEVYLKSVANKKLTWWLSYAYAFVHDDITTIVSNGIEQSLSRKVPGKYDQRHTFNLDMNYRPNSKWLLSIACQYHSGLPFTDKKLRSYEMDGETRYYTEIGELNGANLPAYLRFDVRINRYFQTPKGRFTVFLELVNILNRKNVAYYYFPDWYYKSQLFLTRYRVLLLPRLPSIGVSWSWEP